MDRSQQPLLVRAGAVLGLGWLFLGEAGSGDLAQGPSAAAPWILSRICFLGAGGSKDSTLLASPACPWQMYKTTSPGSHWCEADVGVEAPRPPGPWLLFVLPLQTWPGRDWGTLPAFLLWAQRRGRAGSLCHQLGCPFFPVGKKQLIQEPPVPRQPPDYSFQPAPAPEKEEQSILSASCLTLDNHFPEWGGCQGPVPMRKRGGGPQCQWAPWWREGAQAYLRQVIPAHVPLRTHREHLTLTSDGNLDRKLTEPPATQSADKRQGWPGGRGSRGGPRPQWAQRPQQTVITEKPLWVLGIVFQFLSIMRPSE